MQPIRPPCLKGAGKRKAFDWGIQCDNNKKAYKSLLIFDLKNPSTNAKRRSYPGRYYKLLPVLTQAYNTTEVKIMANIRKMKDNDRDSVIGMMRVFYASDAVSTNGSDEIFSNDFENCVNDSPYLEGYIFEKDGATVGYGMIAKSFSTEFGKPCIWIEDIYLKPEFRHGGIGTKFLKFVEECYPDALLRLEAEPENEKAVNAYKKCGYTPLPYLELKK